MRKVTKKTKVIKKVGKHLKFYKRSIRNGRMEGIYGEVYGGLCTARIADMDKELLDRFKPTSEDRKKLGRLGKNVAWWGSDDQSPRYLEFTPLRQNIVLFMAAINREL